MSIKNLIINIRLIRIINLTKYDDIYDIDNNRYKRSYR